MGKKSGPSAPPPPDPYATANAQGDLNKKTAAFQAKLNRLNETTPYGSVQYSRTGDKDSPFQRITTLDPAEQALLDSQRGTELKLSDLGGTILDRVSPDLATPFTLDGLPPAAVANDATRTRVEQALLERMQPYLDRDRAALETQLANQGFDRSSAAFQTSLDEQNRAENDARLAAIAQGGTEQSRLFGLESSARQQAIQEAALERSQPLNEIAAILGTGQVQTPNFGAVPQVGVASPDLMGAVYNSYNSQVAQANAARQARGSALGGLLQAGGTLFGGLYGGPAGAKVGGAVGGALGGF